MCVCGGTKPRRGPFLQLRSAWSCPRPSPGGVSAPQEAPGPSLPGPPPLTHRARPPWSSKAGVFPPREPLVHLPASSCSRFLLQGLPSYGRHPSPVSMVIAAACRRRAVKQEGWTAVTCPESGGSGSGELVELAPCRRDLGGEIGFPLTSVLPSHSPPCFPLVPSHEKLQRPILATLTFLKT